MKNEDNVLGWIEPKHVIMFIIICSIIIFQQSINF